MRFPALSLCLAGVMASAAFACQDGTDADRPSPASRSGDYAPSPSANTDYRGVDQRELYRNPDPMLRDPYTGASVHAGARMYTRTILFPELQDERMVAAEVAEIIRKQQREAAELRAMAPRAQTVGFTNVSTVYDAMAADHLTLADFGSNWLASRGYSVPTPPTEVQVADEPAASVDRQIQLHEQALAEAREKRLQSRSSTVRGMLLWAQSTTTHHLSLLRTLDRDVDLGRKTVSAALRMQLAPAGTSTASSTELIEQYIKEERALFPAPTAPEVAMEEPAAERVVEKPVVEERIVEKIVEKPVVVEKIVEKPVIVEKIVEKPVYIERPAQSRVAGQRQTVRSRARRPAK
jgi:hypothetical protein